MRFIGLQVVVAAWLLGVVASVSAGVLDTVDVPVESRSQEAREQALGQGLNEVLVRISGKTSVLDTAVAQEAAEQLERWVTRYDYRDDSLRVHYDVQGLMALLSSRQAPVWGLPRPRLLVWLVDQGAGKGEMVSEGHPLYLATGAQANRRGLALVFPAWDDEDRQILDVADIRGRFDDRLMSASQRYPHEMILSAVLYSGTPATLSWRILQGQKTLEQGRLKAADDAAALVALSDTLADKLADRFAVTGGAAEQRTLLTVNQVDSLGDWRQLQTFLQNISGMQQAEMVQVSDASVVFALDFSAGDRQLRNLLELSTQLIACPDAAVAGPQWRYCWQD